jgi:hypothetical protein
MRTVRFLGWALLVVAVVQPAVAQRKYPPDPQSTTSRACRTAVREQAGREFSNAQSVKVNLENGREWQQNEVETFVTGEGRYERRNGSWRTFRFQCIYYLRTGEVTAVEIKSDPGGDEPGDAFGVSLFRDPGYRGVSETFTEDKGDLRRSLIGDDQTTSVRVSGGCQARLYQDLDFRGAYLEVTADVGDLRGTRVGDDSITSIRVRCDGRGWPDEPGDKPQDGWDDDPFNQGVTLFRDPDFGGTSQTFSSDQPDLRDSRIGDDQATSVRVSRGCRARLYQDLNFRGPYTEVSADVPNLRGSRVGDDSVTSLQVRCDR